LLSTEIETVLKARLCVLEGIGDFNGILTSLVYLVEVLTVVVPKLEVEDVTETEVVGDGSFSSSHLQVVVFEFIQGENLGDPRMLLVKFEM